MLVTKSYVDTMERRLNIASNMYYSGNSAMSDADFDMRIRELKRIREDHPDWFDEKSILNRVGGNTDVQFETVKHPFKMHSLNDVFSFIDVERFVDKQREKEFIVEPKIDGASLLVTYENGVLVRAETRGDGESGDDITEHAYTFSGLPQTIEDKNTIYVRGEVYLTKEQFASLQADRQKNSLPAFQNARNTVAGTLHLKDIEEVRRRKLSFLAFSFENGAERGFNSDEECLYYLYGLGFDVVNCFLTDNPVEAVVSIGNARDRYMYDIDGAAVKVNNLVARNRIGYTSKYPKWAVAFKYPAEVVETPLESIEYQIGRSGVVTPVAQFKTVNVCGTQVSRATLNNERFMRSLDLHDGDILSISKAGDIIPEIVSTKRGQNNAKRIHFITHCPSCNSVLVDSGAKKMCVNRDCFARNRMQYVYYCAKGCANLDGFGDKMITKLIDEGLISPVFNLLDLYGLRKEDLILLDGIGERKAIKLRQSLDNAMHVELWRVINGLGIPSVGDSTAKIIAKHFQTFDKFMNASRDELVKLKTVGDEGANSIVTYLQKNRYTDNFKFLAGEIGVNVAGKTLYMDIQSPANDNVRGKLSGLNIVITGKFAMTRRDITNIIQNNGGNVSGSVSSKTDILVAGDDAGKKRDRAEQLGVKVISIDELLNMV